MMKSGEGHQAQRHLGIGRQAEHGVFEQDEEIVARLAVLARGLIVFDQGLVEADFRHQPAEIGIGLVQAAKNLDDRPVVETESHEMLDLLNMGHAGDQLVEQAPCQAQRDALVQPAADRHDHLVAGLPFLDESRDQLRRRLQIRKDADHGVAGGLEDRVVR